MQRNVRESFDAKLLDWARAVIAYTKETQPNSTQLKKVVSGIEESHPGMFVLLHQSQLKGQLFADSMLIIRVHRELCCI